MQPITFIWKSGIPLRILTGVNARMALPLVKDFSPCQQGRLHPMGTPGAVFTLLLLAG